MKSVQHVDLLIYQGTLDLLDQVLGYDQYYYVDIFWLSKLDFNTIFG